MTEEKALMQLFISPTCPHCPKAKKTAEKVVEERDDVELKKYVVTTDKGGKKAEELGIKVVPTFVITGEEAEQPLGLKGDQPEETLNDFVDAANGKKSMEEINEKYS